MTSRTPKTRLFWTLNLLLALTIATQVSCASARQSSGESAGLRGESYFEAWCEGDIQNMGVPLNLKKQDKDHGKFTYGPESQIPANENDKKFFLIENKSSAEIGPQGSLQYSTGDGTVFELDFHVPWTGSPDFSIACSSGSCGKYDYRYESTKKGTHKYIVNYYINAKH